MRNFPWLLALVPYYIITTTRTIPHKCNCNFGLPNVFCPLVVVVCSDSAGPAPAQLKDLIDSELSK